MTRNELIKIKGLLEALARKCKTDALYLNTKEGIFIIDRELGLKDMNFSKVKDANSNIV